MIKDRILYELVKNKINNEINDTRVSPFITSIYGTEGIKLSTILSAKNIPIVKYKSDVSYKDFSEEMSKILSCFQSLNKYTDYEYSSYLSLIDKYEELHYKIDYLIKRNQNKTNKLALYSCINIDNEFSSQTNNSYCGKIGKFITLPFFMDGVTLYNDTISMTHVSSGSTIFSNLDTIDMLPFLRKPSIKISSPNNTISLNLNTTMADLITANGFYVKFSTDITKMTISMINNGTNVYTYTCKDNEVFLSFNPVQFNLINIYIEANNLNSDKPLSIQISDMIIFTNIQFSQGGSFESLPVEINKTKDITSISLNYNIINNNLDELYSLMSMSKTQEDISYNTILLNEEADISLYRYNNSFNFKNSDLDILDKQINGVDFNSYTINNTDNKYNMDYNNAIILYGINKDYLNTNQVNNDIRFCNWTKSDNYYITTLLNYYDNVFINIGSLVCSINGKEFTGNIKIPNGISTIKVHSKDMNLQFGSVLNKSDTINPYNFAYLFSGLPEYNSSGTFTSNDLKSKTYNISSVNVIEIGMPFIPLTETVIDNYGNTYTISFNKSPTLPGTYIIDPYNGRLIINPLFNAKSVTITYAAADINKRPAGIIFNRLLTFGKINTLIQSNDNSLFSIDGVVNSQIQEKYLILPKITEPISYSSLLFNTSDDKLYSSIKMKMKTKNKYISMAISNIYISAK